MNIRSIHEKDFARLIALFAEFSKFQKSAHLMTNSIERMSNEQSLINGFLLEHDGDIVGYVTFFFCYHTWSGKALHMDDLYVKPSYRGQGFGNQLIQKVIHFAKENGCHSLRWQVSRWNENAQEFYQKLGAEIDSTEINCRLDL